MPKRITIHEEDYERIRQMSKEDAGLILHNLLHTLYGEPVEIKGDAYIDYFSENACAKMMRFIEVSEKKSQSAKKGGGAPIGNQNAKKQTENKQKTNIVQTKNKPNTNTNTNTNNIYKRKNQFTDIVTRDVDFEKLEKQLIKN